MAADAAQFTVRQPNRAWCLLAALAMSGNLQAQELRTSPTTSLGVRLSDNPFQSPANRAQTNWIGELGVGLYSIYDSRTSRISVDYRVNRLTYSSSAEADSTQHFLNANLRTDVVDDFFVIDGTSSISQLNRSAFGVASGRDESNSSSNRVETRTASVTPTLKGRIGGDLQFQVRTSLLVTRAGSGLLPDSRSLTSFAGLRNDLRSAFLGWSLESEDLIAEGDNLSRRRNSKVRASLIYAMGSNLNLTVFGGREQSNLDGQNVEASQLRGAGLSWSPSERTQFSIIGGKRFFGNDYVALFAHRMPLAAVRLGVVRDVSFLGAQADTRRPNVLFSLLTDLLAAGIPDPLAREEAARRRFEQSGAASSPFTAAGVATTRPVINQRAEMTILALGQRNTVSVSLSSRRQQGFDTPATGSFVAPAENVRQAGSSASWSYRLSPRATVAYSFGILHSESLDEVRNFTWQRQHGVTLGHRLGPETTATLAARRSQISSNAIQSHIENSLGVTISHRF